MRVQRVVEPLDHPNNYFPRQEYILADSGFTARNQVIPMFRKTRAYGGVMRGRPAFFNLRAVTMRYQVEQAIGILKSRWMILRNLPFRLRTVKDQALAHAFIVACVMLHNMVIKTDDEPLDQEEHTSVVNFFFVESLVISFLSLSNQNGIWDLFNARSCQSFLSSCLIPVVCRQSTPVSSPLLQFLPPILLVVSPFRSLLLSFFRMKFKLALLQSLIALILLLHPLHNGINTAKR